ncbi:MAG: hypothetical protein OQK52_11705 [Ignavibacteriaceae bacterium]|nr:hypothetical protein [Ignavibacteriaceae bacterium]
MPAENEDFAVTIRLLPEDIFNKYKNDPAFNYDNSQDKAEDWITKIKNWINQQLVVLRSSKAFSTALDYFYYALAILALILIIRGLIKGDRRGFIFGEIVNNDIVMIEDKEDIHQLDFDDLITFAMESKQFKVAIRYLFLKSLKLLADRDLIELKNNKTNHQYISEINNSQISNAFQRATFSFEWIWYGDFPVDEYIMKNSQSDFNELFGLIASI